MHAFLKEVDSLQTELLLDCRDRGEGATQGLYT